MSFDWSKIQEQPPVWLIRLRDPVDALRPPVDFVDLRVLDPLLPTSAFRGVSIDRLQNVLDNGIDVLPTDSVIYADSYSKAWEYGGMPKVVLALKWAGLDRTWRELPAATPEAEIAALRLQFGTEVRSDDGSRIWLSRLPDSDRRVGTDYETSYARWIPGNPFDCLRAVLIFARPEDEQSISSALRARPGQHGGAADERPQAGHLG